VASPSGTPKRRKSLVFMRSTNLSSIEAKKVARGKRSSAVAAYPKSHSARLRATRIRRNNLVAFLCVRSCSQMRSTRQPRFRRIPLTSQSRRTFRASLAFQNATRLFGILPWRGHPCQKQPSTNTARFSVRKMKSGLPGIRAPRRQPTMRCFRSNAIKRSSVLRFPRERTRDIRSERSTTVSVSDTTTSLADIS
jgi:hypothetical protein